ncbi:uncharacterized protein LOC131686179 [Topomyia yanbarensis]|uniref:uncharacterized protein LOC131686179 n=1 Tax=Topomyia yanbarensis TaxID=2498891 RepID=UPI00273AB853|nr:uncharacterized protein LOC131686179 [Topomyia yanbarensis]
MSVPLDAREILCHLNQLGYRNITPDQLKEFQKDLRKLIKFDTRISDGTVERRVLQQTTQHLDTFQRLHTLTTISYDAKVAGKRQPGSKVQSAASSRRTDVTEEEAHHHHSHPKEGKENRPARIKTKQQHPEKEPAANKMWIRPRSTSANKNRKNDPVSLYHAYQKEWARFKNQLPGENSHSDLRWQVRTKLLAEK